MPDQTFEAANEPDPRGTGEEVLAGGKLNTVVRVGDTVRRPAGPWTETVHGLLRHLASKKYPYSPTPLGFDDQGREILSFIPGVTVGEELPWPEWVWSEQLLADVARATRSYHEAAKDYRPPGRLPWFWDPAELRADQIVCHHDLAPYNVVVESGRLRGIIDWDLAGPGTSLSDLAFVAWQWVPLHDPFVTSLFCRESVDISRRLNIVLDSYGLEDRSDFIAQVISRIELNRDVMLRKASEGDAAYARLVQDGHVMGMNRAIDFLTETGSGLQAEVDRSHQGG